MAVSGPLNDAYRLRVAGAVNGLLARLAAVWLVLWDPRRPLYSAGLAAEVTASWTEGAQEFTAAETARWLLALTVLAGGRPGGPFRVPAGLVGSSAAGGRLRDMTRLAPSVWFARAAAGAGAEECTAAVVSWLSRLASSEPYRVANHVTLYASRMDPRLTGRVIRRARPGACAFCLALAERGYSPAAAGFPAHGHCHCTAEPEIGHKR
jgi:hypothetical protein